MIRPAATSSRREVSTRPGGGRTGPGWRQQRAVHAEYARGFDFGLQIGAMDAERRLRGLEDQLERMLRLADEVNGGALSVEDALDLANLDAELRDLLDDESDY